MQLELSCLDPSLTHEGLLRSNFVATYHSFDAIVVPASMVADTLSIVNKSILISSAIDFPGGQENMETRVHSVLTSHRKGASLVDLAINNTYVVDKQWDRLEKDILGCLNVAKINGTIVRVVLEYSIYLDKKGKLEQDQLIALCNRLKKWGVEYVVTSTCTRLDDTVDNIITAYEIERHTGLFAIVASPRIDKKQYEAVLKAGIYGLRFNSYKSVENIFGRVT